MAKKENKMVVERETFEKDGKTYFSYFMKGNLRGRDVKIAIAPPNSELDKGGYTVLDIVFGDKMQADLVIEPFEIKDRITGRVITGNTFIVRSVDENGEVYECNVKPFRASDKALLNMLIK